MDRVHIIWPHNGNQMACGKRAYDFQDHDKSTHDSKEVTCEECLFTIRSNAIKPQAFKPAFYATCYQRLQQIARDHGYNLLVHGSMNRDLDLVAVPWAKEIKPHADMIRSFAENLDGKILMHTETDMCNHMGHGRLGYVIDLHRFDKEYVDHQFYLDIAVFPGIEEKGGQNG